jgi:membrane protein YqaA with SNARE-associated domain
MNLIEKYVFLFTDTLYSNFVLSMNSELALDVMRYLGQTNYATWVIIFVALAIIGSVNYVFGVVVYNIFIKYSNPANKLRYANTCLLWNKYYLPIMLFCIFHPCAKILVFSAGFTKFSFWRSIVILLICKAFAYGFLR